MAKAPVPIHCPQCEYAGPVLVAHYGYKWWMLVAAFLVACTGFGALPVGIVLILLGNRTYQACPRCGQRENLAAWVGPHSPDADAIWRQAHAADQVRFNRNKLMLLAVVLIMLAAALVFMYSAMR